MFNFQETSYSFPRAHCCKKIAQVIANSKINLKSRTNEYNGETKVTVHNEALKTLSVPLPEIFFANQKPISITKCNLYNKALILHMQSSKPPFHNRLIYPSISNI